MNTELEKAFAAAGRGWLSFAEVSALPIIKTDLAFDKAERAAVRRRAEAKGDKAHELLNSCNFDPALVREWVNDYGVRA